MGQNIACGLFGSRLFNTVFGLFRSAENITGSFGHVPKRLPSRPWECNAAVFIRRTRTKCLTSWRSNTDLTPFAKAGAKLRSLKWTPLPNAQAMAMGST